MIKKLLGFFTGSYSKIIMYVCIFLALTTAITGFYFYAYNKGSTNEKNKLAAEYAKVLEETVKANNARITSEFQIKLNAVKVKEVIVTKYVERKKQTEEIVQKSTSLNNPVCVQEDLTLDNLNKATRRPK